jgi:2-oxoglutarate ferredoxin oxidoreductase subunit gamma
MKLPRDLGDRRMTNMVLLGGLLANLPVISLEAVERALNAHLPARHHRLLPLNMQALRRGAEYLAVETA